MPEPECLKVVAAKDGVNLSVVSDTYRIMEAGADTGNAYAAIDMLIPPGGGPGPHSHAKIQETFYVLDGEVEVRTAQETLLAKKGDCVTVPLGGLVHAFKSRTQSVAHLICLVTPAGI